MLTVKRTVLALMSVVLIATPSITHAHVVIVHRRPAVIVTRPRPIVVVHRPPPVVVVHHPRPS